MEIDCYEANDWIGTGILRYGITYLGNPVQPSYELFVIPSSPSRVSNSSWVGDTSEPADASDILRRLDFVIETDEFIQVVAPANSTTNQRLLISAYNSISVGRSDGSHQRGAVHVDTDYIGGRVKPDIVAPMTSTSAAAPIGASAAALLIQTGRSVSLSTDPIQDSTTNRAGHTIMNAERTEVIKAALMAGAERVTHNGSFSDITDYRIMPDNQSSNGLDIRFGAGQLNIYHSYHIISAGEQNSHEDFG